MSVRLSRENNGLGFQPVGGTVSSGDVLPLLCLGFARQAGQDEGIGLHFDLHSFPRLDVFRQRFGPCEKGLGACTIRAFPSQSGCCTGIADVRQDSQDVTAPLPDCEEDIPIPGRIEFQEPVFSPARGELCTFRIELSHGSENRLNHSDAQVSWVETRDGLSVARSA